MEHLSWQVRQAKGLLWVGGSGLPAGPASSLDFHAAAVLPLAKPPQEGKNEKCTDIQNIAALKISEQEFQKIQETYGQISSF